MNMCVTPLWFRVYVSLARLSYVLYVLLIAVICKEFVTNYCNRMYLNCIMKVTEFGFAVNGFGAVTVEHKQTLCQCWTGWKVAVKSKHIFVGNSFMKFLCCCYTYWCKSGFCLQQCYLPLLCFWILFQSRLLHVLTKFYTLRHSVS